MKTWKEHVKDGLHGEELADAILRDMGYSENATKRQMYAFPDMTQEQIKQHQESCTREEPCESCK